MAEHPTEEPNTSVVATGVRGGPSVPRDLREAFGRLLRNARGLPDDAHKILVSMDDLENVAHSMLVDFELQSLTELGVCLIPLPLFSSEKDGRELTEREEQEEQSGEPAATQPVDVVKSDSRTIFGNPPRSQFQELIGTADKEHDAVLAIATACKNFDSDTQKRLLNQALDYLGLAAILPQENQGEDLAQKISELQNVKTTVELCLGLGSDATAQNIAFAILKLSQKDKNDST